MTAHESTEVEGTDLEPRTVRGLTEYLTVLGDIGRARGADDLYLVVSQSGSEYLVDARDDVCECPDYEYRTPDGGCKHIRRVRYATGEHPIPTGLAPTALDSHLGQHVAGTPHVAIPSGGMASTDGDTSDTDDADEHACEECAALPDDFPCTNCYISGRRDYFPE
jgi:hypothetical protein